jgi:hypothetical protein
MTEGRAFTSLIVGREHDRERVAADRVRESGAG